MSTTLTDELYTQLEGEPLRQMSQQLGIGPAQMAGALSAALPMLLGSRQGGAGGRPVLDQDGDGQVGFGDLPRVGSGMLSGRR